MKQSRTRVTRSNRVTETRFGRNRNAIRPAACIAMTARRIWPRNTAAHLAAVARVNVRTAELWLAGAPPSFESFLALLWSANGSAFLEAAMAEAPHAPTYWLGLQRQLRIGQAREAELAAKRERERLERGEDM